MIENRDDDFLRHQSSLQKKTINRGLLLGCFRFWVGNRNNAKFSRSTVGCFQDYFCKDFF